MSGYQVADNSSQPSSDQKAPVCPTHTPVLFPGCDQGTTPAPKNPSEMSPRNMSSQYEITMN